MDNILADFISDKMWSDIRSGSVIDSYLAKTINTYSLIERSLVNLRRFPDDTIHLINMINSEDVYISRLGIILTQYEFSRMPEILDLLLQKWNSTSWKSKDHEFLIKVALMYRLLDNDNLDNTVQWDIYEYIIHNFSKWSDKVLEFYQFDGQYEKLIEITNASLNDKKNPDAKKWIYLLLLANHPDKSRIKEIVLPYASSHYPLVKQVAESITNDTFPKAGASLEADVARSIYKMGVIERLREKITLNDVGTLKRLITDSDNYLAAKIGIILIQPIQHNPEIRQFVIGLWNCPTWKSEEWEFNLRTELMFRLLDYADLDIETHESILLYIQNNLRKWMNECLGYYEHEKNWDKFFAIMNEKLIDKRFPKSKAWIYLLLLYAHPDKYKVSPVLTQYENAEHPMVKKVACMLLESPCTKLYGISL